MVDRGESRFRDSRMLRTQSAPQVLKKSIRRRNLENESPEKRLRAFSETLGENLLPQASSVRSFDRQLSKRDPFYPLDIPVDSSFPSFNKQDCEISKFNVRKETLIRHVPSPFHCHYLVKGSIGKGSWGQVFVGTNRLTRQEFAIKKLSKVHSTELPRFRQEAQIMKSVDHPNIIRVYSIFEDFSNIFMIMEYCRGGELYEHLAKLGKFPEPQAAIMMKQMFSAVAYLQKNNIIHRDLKPENWLFLEASLDSPLKLIDFGLARRFQSGTTFRTKAGTLYYVSPQVLAGEYDEKCDIWSLGVVMYVLITGYPPFNASNEALIASAISRSRPTFDSNIWSRLSGDAKKLCQSLLSRDPAKRPTASEALNHSWFSKMAPHVLDLFFLPRSASAPSILGIKRKNSSAFFLDPSKKRQVSGAGGFAEGKGAFLGVSKNDGCCSLAPLGTHSPLCVNFSVLLHTRVQLPSYTISISPDDTHKNSRASSVRDPGSDGEQEVEVSAQDLEELQKEVLLWIGIVEQHLKRWHEFSKKQTVAKVARVVLAQLAEDSQKTPLARQIFNFLDINGDGEITSDDLIGAFRILARIKTMASPQENINDENFDFEDSDRTADFRKAKTEDHDTLEIFLTKNILKTATIFNSTPCVGYSEFLGASLSCKETGVDENAIQGAFRTFDSGAFDSVSKNELCKVLGWDKVLTSEEHHWPETGHGTSNLILKSEKDGWAHEKQKIVSELNMLFPKIGSQNLTSLTFQRFHSLLREDNEREKHFRSSQPKMSLKNAMQKFHHIFVQGLHVGDKSGFVSPRIEEEEEEEEEEDFETFLG